MQVCQALCSSLAAIFDFLKNLTWPITQLHLPTAWSNLHGEVALWSPTCKCIRHYGGHMVWQPSWILWKYTHGCLELSSLSKVDFVHICCGPDHGLPKYVVFVVLHPDLHLQMSMLSYKFSACWVTPNTANSTWKFSKFFWNGLKLFRLNAARPRAFQAIAFLFLHQIAAAAWHAVNLFSHRPRVPRNCLDTGASRFLYPTVYSQSEFWAQRTFGIVLRRWRQLLTQRQFCGWRGCLVTQEDNAVVSPMELRQRLHQRHQIQVTIECIVCKFVASRIDSHQSSVASYLRHIWRHVKFWRRPAFCLKTQNATSLLQLYKKLPWQQTWCIALDASCSRPVGCVHTHWFGCSATCVLVIDVDASVDVLPGGLSQLKYGLQQLRCWQIRRNEIRIGVSPGIAVLMQNQHRGKHMHRLAVWCHFLWSYNACWKQSLWCQDLANWLRHDRAVFICVWTVFWAQSTNILQAALLLAEKVKNRFTLPVLQGCC